MANVIKKVVSGIELTMSNGSEIMHIGGPYICTLSVGDKLIAHDCLSDDFVFDEKGGNLFFVKAHLERYYWFFTINFYSFNKDEIYEFVHEFDMVYIKQFTNPDTLEIYDSFHDKFPEKRYFFYLDKEKFVVPDISLPIVDTRTEPNAINLKKVFIRIVVSVIGSIIFQVIYIFAGKQTWKSLQIDHDSAIACSIFIFSILTSISMFSKKKPLAVDR